MAHELPNLILKYRQLLGMIYFLGALASSICLKHPLVTKNIFTGSLSTQVEILECLEDPLDVVTGYNFFGQDKVMLCS